MNVVMRKWKQQKELGKKRGEVGRIRREASVKRKARATKLKYG